MATARLISRSISTSKRWNRLSSWFAKTLYMLLIVHTDDYGIIDGDAEEIKWKVLPAAQEGPEEIETALNELQEVGLICRYEWEDHQLIEILQFDKFQQGLQKRTGRRFPSCQDVYGKSFGITLDYYSEVNLEAHTINLINEKRLLFGEDILHIERQKRIGNSYLDLVIYSSQHTFVVEIKRCPVSNSAIDQTINYIHLLSQKGTSAIGVVLGCGLAGNLDIQKALKMGISIGVYDANLNLSFPVLSKDVNLCYLMLKSGFEGGSGESKSPKSPENGQPERDLLESVKPCYLTSSNREGTLSDVPLEKNRIGIEKDIDTILSESSDSNEGKSSPSISINGKEDSLSPKEFWELYNVILGDILPKATKFTEDRKEQISKRLKKNPSKTYWIRVFEKTKESPFLTGQSEGGWRADLDWIVKNEKIHVRIYEGRYDRNNTEKYPRGKKEYDRDAVFREVREKFKERGDL